MRPHWQRALETLWNCRLRRPEAVLPATPKVVDPTKNGTARDGPGRRLSVAEGISPSLSAVLAGSRFFRLLVPDPEIRNAETPFGRVQGVVVGDLESAEGTQPFHPTGLACWVSLPPTKASRFGILTRIDAHPRGEPYAVVWTSDCHASKLVFSWNRHEVDPSWVRRI